MREGPQDARQVEIRLDGDSIMADLTVPKDCQGIVAFAHGSGSSRHSPRNRYVATSLVAGGFATVLADLLTPAEAAEDEQSARIRFDIDLLTRRIIDVLDWTGGQEDLRTLPLGLFGASTGAAAALAAAAARPGDVAAVVSRGGRPDLAGESLPLVRAPTLLIVGGHDPKVLQLNRSALDRLECEASLEIVRGATHLFEEPGTLERVTRLAKDWFRNHLRMDRTLSRRSTGGRDG